MLFQESWACPAPTSENSPQNFSSRLSRHPFLTSEGTCRHVVPVCMCQAHTYTLNSLKYVTLISWFHHGTAGQANQDDRPHPLLDTVVPLICGHQETVEDHRMQDDSGNLAPLTPSGALSLTSPQCLWILRVPNSVYR